MTALRPLTPGARLGSYEILSALGAGGMGEVYRARDTRLGRDVAIKILPAAFALDPDRVARFEREARTLAALNHPNIGSLHGVHESDGVTALVMELVDGEELAARIARGALPVTEALAIARQIADALQAAHDQGIVHRDLKPANIKVRPDGTVKILDFGLAMVLDPAAGSDADPMSAPTITGRATELGVILGTVAYMAPEQAKGQAVDRRADIWAFGCVLYEMLTGRRAFQGNDPSDVLASVLARDPDLTGLPPGVPPPVRRLLRRCFEKDPRARLRDVGDARLEIQDALDDREPVAVATASARRFERALWIAAVTLLAGTAVLLAWTGARPRAPAAPEARLEISTPSSLAPASVAISPDGRTIAFVATGDGQSRLWVRPLASSVGRPLAGTDGAVSPFWSPDSRSIGFFASSRLKRVDLDGGAVHDLAHVNRGTGGTWSRDDVILFSSLGDPIARIKAGGGQPQELPDLVQQGSNFSPHFLPDGRRFLYYVRGTSDVRGLYVGQLDGASPRQRLLEADPGAVFASGHLLFVRQRTLFAQPFDPGSLGLSGSPVPVSDPSGDCRCGRLSVSDAGAIVFRTAAPATPQVAWFDRSGAEAGVLGPLRIFAPSLSRDDRRIVGYGANPADGNVDVWLFDSTRGASERLTIHVADDVTPVWSPAGDRVVFASNRAGTHDLYQKRASADAPEDLVLATPQEKVPSDWSRDGRFILFDSRDFARASDIWALPLEGGGKPFAVAQTEFDETRGQFSPDGRWVAYQSSEAGRHEIYLQRFPAIGDKRRVSTGGGSQVRWSHSGDELFYMAPEGRLMAVRVRLTPAGEAPELGAPVALFATSLGTAAQLGDYRHQYAVSSDGRRFLLATSGEAAHVPITVILNWRR